MVLVTSRPSSVTFVQRPLHKKVVSNCTPQLCTLQATPQDFNVIFVPQSLLKRAACKNIWRISISRERPLPHVRARINSEVPAHWKRYACSIMVWRKNLWITIYMNKEVHFNYSWRCWRQDIFVWHLLQAIQTEIILNRYVSEVPAFLACSSFSVTCFFLRLKSLKRKYLYSLCK